MVGRLNDIVTAAVVVGATDKVDNFQKAAQADKADESRSIEKTQSANIQDENLFEKDEKDNFHLEPGSVNEDTVDFMTRELNDLMSKTNYNLQFDYHQFEEVMTVQMIDKKTDEVIKEMPPEELVESIMKAKIWLGAFIDKTF